MSVDPSAISDPVLRQRTELGHHPRREAKAIAAEEPVGWYRAQGRDLYRAAAQLLYRIDDIDGMYQAYRADWRPGVTPISGHFGPRLNNLISARVLIEADAKVRMKEST